MNDKKAKELIKGIPGLSDFVYRETTPKGIQLFDHPDTGQSLKVIDVEGKPKKIRLYDFDHRNKQDILLERPDNNGDGNLKPLPGDLKSITKDKEGNITVVPKTEKLSGRQPKT